MLTICLFAFYPLLKAMHEVVGSRTALSLLLCAMENQDATMGVVGTRSDVSRCP